VGATEGGERQYAEGVLVSKLDNHPPKKPTLKIPPQKHGQKHGTVQPARKA
jgi:hypothetical protein